jgi:hypothetical protein
VSHTCLATPLSSSSCLICFCCWTLSTEGQRLVPPGLHCLPLCASIQHRSQYPGNVC